VRHVARVGLPRVRSARLRGEMQVGRGLAARLLLREDRRRCSRRSRAQRR
jgi:hypothetical protein